MRIAAAIMADLERSPLGTASRLAAPLCGAPVLRRTVERAIQATRINGVIVICPSPQRSAIGDVLAGLPVEIATFDGAPAPYAALVQAGRAWGLHGWRGGIGGLCAFDEDIHVPVLAACAGRAGLDAVACVPAHAALIPPAVIDAVVAHYERFSHLLRMAFAPAPPGLAPAVFGAELLNELAPTAQPPGSLLLYRPDQPAPDLVGKECCCRLPAVVSETRARLLADTQRGFSRLEALLREGAQAWSAEQIAVRAREFNFDAGFPEEIEIELTTDDPLADRTILRPRGQIVGRRGPIDLPVVERICKSLRNMDDTLIVLGGFGDPFLHPQLVEIVHMLKSAGAMAVAVRTTGLPGDRTLDEKLFDLPVDVLCVTLDADSPGAYQTVHGVDAFARAKERIERWSDWRRERIQVRPLIVPEMIKSTQTFEELESFFDGWSRRLGWAVVEGHSHRAGQLPDHSVTSTAPPRRIPCRRLWTRALVLADGRVVACDQDFAAKMSLGRLPAHGLDEIWRGQAFGALRAAHRAGEFGQHPLCPTCTEWHRP